VLEVDVRLRIISKCIQEGAGDHPHQVLIDDRVRVCRHKRRYERRHAKEHREEPHGRGRVRSGDQANLATAEAYIDYRRLDSVWGSLHLVRNIIGFARGEPLMFLKGVHETQAKPVRSKRCMVGRVRRRADGRNVESSCTCAVPAAFCLRGSCRLLRTQ
jgi:hypothetical protein